MNAVQSKPWQQFEDEKKEYMSFNMLQIQQTMSPEVQVLLNHAICNDKILNEIIKELVRIDMFAVPKILVYFDEYNKLRFERVYDTDIAYKKHQLNIWHYERLQELIKHYQKF